MKKYTFVTTWWVTSEVTGLPVEQAHRDTFGERGSASRAHADVCRRLLRGLPEGVSQVTVGQVEIVEDGSPAGWIRTTAAVRIGWPDPGFADHGSVAEAAARLAARTRGAA